MADLKCKKPKLCEPVPAPKPQPCSPAFDLCVGDRTLKWDGFCPTVERTRKTPDGTYTSVTVVDGCIVAYGYADEATYTPPYCNPNPTSCQETGSGNTSSAKVSTSVDNSLAQTSDGLYARTYINGGTGVTIAGTGTLTNPYEITFVGSSTNGVNIVGRNGISASTSASSVTYIGLEPTGVSHGSFGVNDVVTFDMFGRIVSVEPRTDPLVSAGTGLTTTTSGDTTVVEHPTVFIDNTMVLGGYTISVNNSGHITSTERGIDITGSTYNLGAYDVTVNSYGSITGIEQRSDVMPEVGMFTTVDGKIFSYDLTGRLTKVEKINTGGATTYSTPLPLRDMYKFNFPVGGASTSYTLDTYGTSISPNISNDRVMTIPLPAYVIDQTQVQVHGASSWRIIPLERLLEVRWTDSTTSFTVTFRG